MYTDMIWGFYYIHTMRLHEPAIGMRPPSASEPDEPFLRSAALWKCLEASIGFFDKFALIAAPTMPSIPLTGTGLMSYAIVTCSRLVFLEGCDDWRPAAAQKRLDYARVLERLADQYESADRWAQQAGRRRRLIEDDGGNAFCKFSFKLRWIRRWYLSRLPQDQQFAQGGGSGSGSDDAELSPTSQTQTQLQTQQAQQQHMQHHIQQQHQHHQQQHHPHQHQQQGTGPGGVPITAMDDDFGAWADMPLGDNFWQELMLFTDPSSATRGGVGMAVPPFMGGHA